MFKALIQWFKVGNLLAQANEQVVEMLKEDLSLFQDSIKLLWTEEGVSIEEIRERDRQINQHVRDVRKKVLTHLAFSGSGGMETALALISIVRDVERIGDHTKDIGYLAMDFPGKFKAGEFESGLKEFEGLLIGRIQILIDILESGDDVREKAGDLTRTHLEVNSRYREMITNLITNEEVGLTPSQSAIVALYMRYLRRVEGHIFNIASAEVNPFHRIGFKKKKKKLQ